MWPRRSTSSAIEATPDGRVLAVLDSGGRAADRLRALKLGLELQLIDHIDDAVKIVNDGGSCVLVIGNAEATPELFAALERLRGKVTLPSIVMADRPGAALLRSALRAGVADVVSTAGSAEDVTEALERAWNEAGGPTVQGGRDGRIVAVFSAKGGVGCTTLAVNLAALAVGRGPTLVVDADLPFGDVSVVLGVEPRNGLADMVGADLDADRLNSALATHSSGLRVLPGPPDPAQAEVITAASISLALEVAKSVADLVIVDTSCAFDDVTLAILEMADDILLVSTPDLASVKNAKIAQSTFRMLGIGDAHVHVVLNRVGSKASLGVAEIESQLGPAEAVIPDDDAFARSGSAGELGALELPRNPVSKALAKLAERITAGGRK